MFKEDKPAILWCWVPGRSNRQSCSFCSEKIPKDVKRFNEERRVREINIQFKICPYCLHLLNKQLKTAERKYIKQRKTEELLNKI